MGGTPIALLVDESRQRLKTRLSSLSALQSQLCAGAIGAPSPEAAQARVANISIGMYATYSGSLDLGPLTLEPDGSFTPGTGAAAYNPNTQDISLNSYIDWAGGTVYACRVDGTNCQRVNLAQGEANRVGANGMSAEQFMDFAILHEIAHSFGLSHPGTNAVNDAAGYNKAIWENCFK
jgi:hypothetical protein